jgi:hypothetical protein
VWRCGAWTVRRAEGDDVLAVSSAESAESPESAGSAGDDALDGLRALCVAHWSRHPEGGAPARTVAGDDRAAAILGGWGLHAS